jgi:Family of unknown function (DUF6279)
LPSNYRIRKLTFVWALSIGLALLFLVGCTKLRMGYEYADWVVIYSVEDNFDLDKAQRTRFKEDVAAYFKWHRREMIPSYAAFLTRVAASLKDGLRPQEIDSAFASYHILLRGTLLPMMDKAVSLLDSLTPNQIDLWVDRQKKKNEKLHKDFSGSSEDRYEHRFTKIIDELEDWTGSLQAEQKAQIKVLNRTLPWNGNLWLDARENATERVADMLRKQAGPKRLRRYLEDYYVYPEKSRNKEYQASQKAFDMRLKTTILMVYRMLTPEQKEHFILQVEKLAKDFQTLSLQE